MVFEFNLSNYFIGPDIKTQKAGEAVCHFMEELWLFVGVRKKSINRELSSVITDARKTRTQLGAGWFPDKNILAKLKYVKQNYSDFAGNICEDGQFDGLMVEAARGF